MRGHNTTSEAFATFMIVALVILLLFTIANSVHVYRLYVAWKSDLSPFELENKLTSFVLATAALILAGVIAFAGLALLGLLGGLKGLYSSVACLWISVFCIPTATQIVLSRLFPVPFDYWRFATLVPLVPLTWYFWRSATIARRFGASTRPGIRADATYWWLRARGRSPKPPSVFTEFE